MSEPILSISNNHPKTIPPVFNRDEHVYTAYFENSHGEQAILVKRTDGKVYLYMGDCDWKPLRVIGGQVPGVTLAPGEAEAIRSLWALATHNGARHADGDLPAKLKAIHDSTGKPGSADAYKAFLHEIGND